MFYKMFAAFILSCASVGISQPLVYDITACCDIIRSVCSLLLRCFLGGGGSLGGEKERRLQTTMCSSYVGCSRPTFCRNIANVSAS